MRHPCQRAACAFLLAAATLTARAAAPPVSAGLGTLPDSLPERYALVATWAAAPASGDDDLYHPEGVDIGRDGLIVVADTGNHRVSVWHMNGDPDARWGARGTGPGQYESPEDVAVDVDRERVYVADTGNRRVQVLARRGGGHLATWPDVGLPRGIAVGPDGRVLVSDAEGDRVLVFMPDGQQQAAWGGPGRAPGRFDTPLGIAVAADGSVLVADSGNQRVQWLDAAGEPVRSLEVDNAAQPGGEPRDVGVDDDGTVFVATDRGVLRFRAGTTFAERIVPLVDSPDGPVPVKGHVEGVRRLAYRTGVGLVLSRAPSLTWGDRLSVYPARWFPTLVPRAEGMSPGWRRVYDPTRIGAGADPTSAHVLDTSGLARVYRSSGQWYDGYHAFPAGPGDDIAARDGGSVVLADNALELVDLRCFGGCPPSPRLAVLDPEMMTRRDKTGEAVPDNGWWNTAVAAWNGFAVLNTGYQQLVVRGEDGSLRLFKTLNAQTRPFRAFRDVDDSPDGSLWVLARDGEVLRFDGRGRSLDPVVLEGLAPRSAEAIAVAAQGDLGGVFVLTADEWVLKFSPTGALLAAWSVAAEAGPGRYVDLALDDQDRVLVPDGANDRTLVFAQAPGSGAGPPPDPRGGPCTVEPSKTADPRRLPLGQTTEVTLRLAASCAGREEVDVALVIDRGCLTMNGDRLAGVRAGTSRLVDGLRRDGDRLAVVGFPDEMDAARLKVPLTDDAAALKATLGAWTNLCFQGAGDVLDGLRAGREALFGPRSHPEAGKVLVLVANGVARRADRAAAMFEARRLWRQGVEVVTVGTGPDQYGAGGDADRGLLASMASRAEAFHYAADPRGLPEVLAGIGAEVSDRVLLRALEVVDRLPANMRLVPGTFSFPPELLPDGALRWRFEDIGPEGAPALSYRVEPLAAGVWPTNVEAIADYVDGLDVQGRRTFPVPEVEVIGPPTATPTSEPSPTGVPPVATQVPSATPTGVPPTASSTPRRATRTAIFLPISYREQCVPQPRPVDVVLVVDTSSSMQGAKLDAAREAARAFVDLLDLARDRAAVVSFDGVARRDQGLTDDRLALRAALDGLRSGAGTRIDLGLWTALDEVGGGRGRPEADPVIVLVTDGRPDGGTEANIRLAVDVARDLGVVVYAIGLGADVQPEVLELIAGDGSRVFLAPTPAELADIYRGVARVIPCR